MADIVPGRRIGWQCGTSVPAGDKRHARAPTISLEERVGLDRPAQEPLDQHRGRLLGAAAQDVVGGTGARPPG